MRIGIFDSGIGGLTVLKELVNKYPNNEYIYIGDTLNVPYGNKTVKELFKLSCSIVDYLINQKVDKIIIACGTISSNLSDILKCKYNIPIIDIITPTINYLQKNNYNSIGVIATNMTVKSRVFSKKLQDKKLIEVACPKLVPSIESNDSDKINIILKEYLDIFKSKDIEILVLGCTHYPTVEKNINNILNKDIKILNMAIPILELFSDNTVSSINILFTKLDTNVIKNTKRILNNIKYNIDEIKLD